MAKPNEPTPVFGKYRLLHKIATGGMAEVFLAEQRGIAGFRKEVVIKRILPMYSQDTRFIEGLLREARLAARLNHPNIVQVYEMGCEDEIYYAAMEYVDGMDMRHITRRARERGYAIPLGHCVKIASSVALALSYAHRLTDTDGAPIGLVHRDISPTNVLIAMNGTVKVVDFGIAGTRYLPGDHRAFGLGKLGFVAPEQLDGDRVDARADIFSLGVLLYEWTTRKPLFRRDSALRTREATRFAPIPLPSQELVDYPKALEGIVMSMLERDLERRASSAEDLHQQLEAFLSGSDHARTASDLAKMMQRLFPRGRQVSRRSDERPSTWINAFFRSSHLPSAEGRQPDQRSKLRAGGRRDHLMYAISIALFALALAGGALAMHWILEG